MKPFCFCRTEDRLYRDILHASQFLPPIAFFFLGGGAGWRHKAIAGLNGEAGAIGRYCHDGTTTGRGEGIYYRLCMHVWPA